MSDHTHDDDAPVNSAKLLLPVVMMGMLILVAIMYLGGMSAGFYTN
jgi:hypothetical protein